MGFIKRIAGIFGFAKDDAHGGDGGVGGGGGEDRAAAANLNRRGFSVRVPMAVERPQLGPILVPCESGDGGVQGFNWYREKLKMDEDGDVAHEFLDELPPPPPEDFAVSEGDKNHRVLPRFEVKHLTRPAPVRNQARIVDGNLQHSVESTGSLQWL